LPTDRILAEEEEHSGGALSIVAVPDVISIAEAD
jgi:hypothetical protein